jgi:tRNA pseudouridine38-40 synthase
MEQKINVGILFGGKSAEHEVSIQSAKNIYEAIDKEKYNVKMIGISKEGHWLLDHNFENGIVPQIVVLDIREAAERFHSRYNVKNKNYAYYIWNHWIPSPFHRKYSYHLPERLDISLMQEAAQKLMGTHDFIGFSSVKKTKKSTIRTIEEISIIKEDNMVKFNFIGDGFLYNMVRIITGTLVEIGLKEKEITYIDEIFEEKNRSLAGKTLPPQGLFLEEVTY